MLQPRRQVVGLRQPVQGAVLRVAAREYLDDAARRRHARDVQFLVGLPQPLEHGGLPLVAQQAFEFVGVGRGEEVRQARPFALDAECRGHVAALDLDHRLAFPVVVVEHPPSQHLLGGQPLVGAFAAQFRGEVTRQRLHGAYPPVVVDVQPPEFLGHVGRQHLVPDVIRACHGGDEHDGDDCRRAPRPLAKHGKECAELAPPLKEEPCHRHDQHGIARIGQPDAPRVVAHRQDAAPHVGVVGGLVEAVVLVPQDLIHRHLARHRLPAAVEPHRAGVVHRGARAGVVGYGKVLKRHRERQRHLAAVPRLECRRTLLAETQVQPALLAPDVRDAAPGQDDDERGVQRECPHAAVQPLAQYVDDGRHHHRPPQGGEPWRAVDVVEDVGSPLALLDHRRRRQRGDDCREQDE